MEEMNKEQLRALEIYLASATYDNNYKPIGFVAISEALKKEGISVGKSTIGRWSKKFDWDKRLELKIQQVIISDKSDDIANKALQATVGRTLDTFEANRKLQDDGYYVLQKYMTKVKKDVDSGRFIKEDVKLAIEIHKLTTGRDDKMYDRLANAPRETVSSNDLIKELMNTEIAIDEDSIDIDFDDIEVEEDETEYTGSEE